MRNFTTSVAVKVSIAIIGTVLAAIPTIVEVAAQVPGNVN